MGKISENIIYIASICFVTILLVWIIAFADKKVNRPGRFETIIGAPNMALDTATGQLCYAYDPIGTGSDQIPLCKGIR